MKITFVTDIFGDEGGGVDAKNSALADGAAKFYTGSQDDVVRGLLFICPCGCKRIRTVPFSPPEQKGWKWNGDRTSPTLAPSIQIIGECRWHGFLTGGEWRRA